MTEAAGVPKKYLGKVKWFNNKSGYGFLSFLNDTDFVNKDIFVHHTSLKVKDELYKYLVQGEYIEFGVQKMTNSKDHEYQAVDITGVSGGDLMCETRFKNKDFHKSNNDFVEVKDTRRGRSSNKH